MEKAFNANLGRIMGEMKQNGMKYTSKELEGSEMNFLDPWNDNALASVQKKYLKQTITEQADLQGGKTAYEKLVKNMAKNNWPFNTMKYMKLRHPQLWYKAKRYMRIKMIEEMRRKEYDDYKKVKELKDLEENADHEFNKLKVYRKLFDKYSREVPAEELAAWSGVLGVQELGMMTTANQRLVDSRQLGAAGLSSAQQQAVAVLAQSTAGQIYGIQTFMPPNYGTAVMPTGQAFPYVMGGGTGGMNVVSAGPTYIGAGDYGFGTGSIGGQIYLGGPGQGSMNQLAFAQDMDSITDMHRALRGIYMDTLDDDKKARMMAGQAMLKFLGIDNKDLQQGGPDKAKDDKPKDDKPKDKEKDAFKTDPDKEAIPDAFKGLKLKGKPPQLFKDGLLNTDANAMVANIPQELVGKYKDYLDYHKKKKEHIEGRWKEIVKDKNVDPKTRDAFINKALASKDLSNLDEAIAQTAKVELPKKEEPKKEEPKKEAPKNEVAHASPNTTTSVPTPSSLEDLQKKLAELEKTVKSFTDPYAEEPSLTGELLGKLKGTDDNGDRGVDLRARIERLKRGPEPDYIDREELRREARMEQMRGRYFKMKVTLEEGEFEEIDPETGKKSSKGGKGGKGGKGRPNITFGN